MKELCGTSANIFAIVDDGKLIPRVELILLYSEPTYRPGLAPAAFEQSREIAGVRFCVDPKGLRALAAEFVELADKTDAEIAKCKGELDLTP